MTEIKPPLDSTRHKFVGGNPNIIYSCEHFLRCSDPLYVGKCKSECTREKQKSMKAVTKNDLQRVHPL